MCSMHVIEGAKGVTYPADNWCVPLCFLFCPSHADLESNALTSHSAVNVVQQPHSSCCYCLQY